MEASVILYFCGRGKEVDLFLSIITKLLEFEILLLANCIQALGGLMQRCRELAVCSQLISDHQK
jgi:hypothetical protein